MVPPESAPKPVSAEPLTSVIFLPGTGSRKRHDWASSLQQNSDLRKYPSQQWTMVEPRPQLRQSKHAVPLRHEYTAVRQSSLRAHIPLQQTQAYLKKYPQQLKSGSWSVGGGGRGEGATGPGAMVGAGVVGVGRREAAMAMAAQQQQHGRDGGNPAHLVVDVLLDIELGEPVALHHLASAAEGNGAGVSGWQAEWLRGRRTTYGASMVVSVSTGWELRWRRADAAGRS